MQDNTAQDQNQNNQINPLTQMGDTTPTNTSLPSNSVPTSSANDASSNPMFGDTNSPVPPQTEQADNIDSSILKPPSESSTGIDMSSVVTAPQAPQKYGGKKVIAAILGLVLMVGAIGTGVFLVQNQQLGVGSAWDCSKYNFNVSKTGVVTVQNGSRFNEGEQKAEIYINNTLVSTLTVPGLTSGQGTTLGTVSVPTQQGFTWKVHGTVDCEDQGSYQPETTPTPSISASCNSVVAYDKNWQQLSAQQLAQLKTGDVVRFSVGGTSSSGSFDRARFTINGTQRPETTTLRPNTSEFYDEYTIPNGTTNFQVNAQIHHSQLGWL